MRKVVNINELVGIREKVKKEGGKVVFTNGCFDILHRGHVDYLEKAKKLGDILIVGLNSDESVKKIKGKKRPIVPQDDRVMVLSALGCVDYVCIFDQETPGELIEKIIPDVLVKGGDWEKENIVGRKIVEENGGEVFAIPEVEGKSTQKIIQTIIDKYCKSK
ncbi:MAG: D-glycero-beta-D-manno-heptose 1-phosphate adenylyltransferase [Candidatus Zixiibacteriota bacterium]